MASPGLITILIMTLMVIIIYTSNNNNTNSISQPPHKVLEREIAEDAHVHALKGMVADLSIPACLVSVALPHLRCKPMPNIA